MAIAHASTAQNIVAADPCVIASLASANDYVTGTYSSDSSNGNNLTFDSTLTQQDEQTSSYDGMTATWAGGKASGTVTSISASGGVVTGITHTYTGVDTTTPEDATIVTGKSDSGVTTTTGISITTVTANALVEFSVNWDQKVTTNPNTSIDDGGAGLTWTKDSCYQTPGVAYRKIDTWYAIKASTGSITVTATTDITSGYGAGLRALRPSGGGGGSVVGCLPLLANVGGLGV